MVENTQEPKKRRVFLLSLEPPTSLRDRMAATPEGIAHPEEVRKLWREICNMHRAHVEAYTLGRSSYSYKDKTYPVQSTMMTEDEYKEHQIKLQQTRFSIDEQNRLAIEGGKLDNKPLERNSSTRGGGLKPNPATSAAAPARLRRRVPSAIPNMVGKPDKSMAGGISKEDDGRPRRTRVARATTKNGSYAGNAPDAKPDGNE